MPKSHNRFTVYHVTKLLSATYPSICILSQVNTHGDIGGCEVTLRYTRSEAAALIDGLTAAIAEHDAEYQPEQVSA